MIRSAPATTLTNRTPGANDRIRMGLIGLNGQGHVHLRECLAERDIEVTALCDVDARVLSQRAMEVRRRTGRRVSQYGDVRDLLADARIDAVAIATPNHWHALSAIWACEAGKDVFVEKPLSHNVREGRSLADTAARTGRVVVHGTQSRWDPVWRRDIRLLHERFIGPIHQARGICFKTGRRASIGHALPTDPPRRLNWSLWQGPAPEAPYCDNYVHYNWHWFWRYGNGEIGNQGVHQMDLAVWGLGVGMPVQVHSTGGRYAWDDQGETPNTQVTHFTYADGRTLVFEVRTLGSFPEAGHDVGNAFFGTEGYYVRGKGFHDYANAPIPVEEPPGPEQTRFGMFVAAVRERTPASNPAPPDAGHVSAAHCHLANIAQRVGRSLAFDPATERFVNAPDADLLLTRTYREGFEVRGA